MIETPALLPQKCESTNKAQYARCLTMTCSRVLQSVLVPITGCYFDNGEDRDSPL